MKWQCKLCKQEFDNKNGGLKLVQHFDEKHPQYDMCMVMDNLIEEVP
jgi:hypothetical protein